MIITFHTQTSSRDLLLSVGLSIPHSARQQAVILSVTDFDGLLTYKTVTFYCWSSWKMSPFYICLRSRTWSISVKKLHVIRNPPSEPMHSQFALGVNMKYWYSSLGCMVRWNGKTGDALLVLCGVRLTLLINVVYSVSCTVCSLCWKFDFWAQTLRLWLIYWHIICRVSRIVYFGLSTKVLCGIYLNGSAIEVVDKIKYLDVYFEQNSGHCDISQTFVKFFSQLNNIVAVLGKHSNEMTALHLIKTYCFLCLLFGCEIWNLSAHSVHMFNFVWNNCFRLVFRGFWRESVRMIQFYYSSLSVSYIIDQRRLFFWKRMLSSDNPVLHSLSYFVSNRALAIGSIYDVTTGISVSVIKDSVWAFFARSIFIVPSDVILHAVFICFYLCIF